MPVEVRVPAVFRSHVAGAKSVETSPGPLRDVLNAIGDSYPGLKDQIFSADDDLQRFVNVYLNDEDIRYLDGLDTKVSDGDVVAILPAVAGGAGSGLPICEPTI